MFDEGTCSTLCSVHVKTTKNPANSRASTVGYHALGQIACKISMAHLRIKTEYTWGPA
jgi:hypothetical protein